TEGGSTGETETVNQFYRVRKGDTLGKIAQRNGVRVTQLQTWNGLRSSTIGVGDQLIIGQRKVPVTKDVAVKDVNTQESSGSSSEENDVISSYLKEQIEKAEERKAGAEI
ncbi:MAG: LysM peptidoglycan-binding domain-containing protein, partial [Bacteroidales bacterium]|nr:LysM peptidoglycan-binding domain-containing protein [Bacteroidales bacterium]